MRRLVLLVLALTLLDGCTPQPDAPGPLCRAFGMCMGGGRYHRSSVDDDPIEGKRCHSDSQCQGGVRYVCVEQYPGSGFGRCVRR